MGERRTAVIIGVVVVVVLAAIGVLFLSGGSAVAPVKLTEITDPAGLQKTVQLTHLSIATSDNFVGQKIRLISGVLTNVSDKPLRSIEVKMAFQNYDGKSIQESVEKAFNPKQRPLAPGEEFRFELAFENLPKDWNYRVPDVTIVKAGY